MNQELSSWIDRVAGRALSHRETVEQSYRLAADVIDRGIPGDLVECGVFAGAQAAAMALAVMNEPGRPRRVHLFDSFEGIPAPGEHDHEFLESGNKPGSAACGLGAVKAHMREWGIPDDVLVYYSGWFADTLPVACGVPIVPGAAIHQIALLRLDGDLYESTKVCMQYLFPLVTHGGWVIVDDYPLSGCRKAIHEVVIPQPMYFQKL